MSRSIQELPYELYEAYQTLHTAGLKPRVVNDACTRISCTCPFHGGAGMSLWHEEETDSVHARCAVPKKKNAPICGDLAVDYVLTTARMMNIAPTVGMVTDTAPEPLGAVLSDVLPEPVETAEPETIVAVASPPVEPEPEVEPVVIVEPVKASPPPPPPRYEQHEVTYDELLSALDRGGFNPKPRGQGHTSQCPAHDDNNPSLDIDRKSNGGVLAICRSAGCSFESIIDALGLKNTKQEKAIKTPYHVRKRVKVHAPAYLDGNDLIIPLIDIRGTKRATQTIWPEKRLFQDKETDKFTKGKGKNEYFFQFGDRSLSDTLLIATGYATSASLFESTGSPVTMSMDDGSLPHTIELLRNRYADKELIVCCDYDARNNKGIISAVNRFNTLLCYPTIEDNLKADFNDLMLRSGKEAVCEVVGNAGKPEVDSADYSEPPEKAQPLPPPESVILRSAASIVPRRIDWLWEGWLAVGKLHLLAGAPGTAKTTIALTLGAAISNGGQFPDGSSAKRGKVLIWSSEDDPRDTLIPRLIAAGADLNNIHIVESVNHSNKGTRVFDPSKDFPLLKSAVEQIGNVSFMVIDSVADAVAGDSGKNNQVRRALAPVKEFSEEMGIATLGITHFNKNVTGKAMSRIIDSVAFVGLPRVVMIAFKKRGNGSLMMRAKSNIGPDNGGYEFYTYMEPLIEYEGIVANRVGWKGYIEGSADDHLRDAESNISEPENEQQKAEKFLMDEFSDGMRRESSAVIEKAKSLGISFDTLGRVRRSLGMATKKINNKWYIYASDNDGESEEPPF